MTITLDLTPVEVDDFRRLVNRLADRNGKQNDSVRVNLLAKLQRAAVNAEADLMVPKCEHGIVEGDWCEPCNKEYKRAAREAGYGE